MDHVTTQFPLRLLLFISTKLILIYTNLVVFEWGKNCASIFQNSRSVKEKFTKMTYFEMRLGSR